MFRKLKASEIECRVATIKANGLSLLLYKDARCDMQLLDETVGAYNWKREHQLIGEVMYCGISIFNEKLHQWTIKWDAGTESYTEKEKGQASDSFKRAGFNWGIGRELYTAPFIWITPKNDKEFKQNGTKYTTYSKFSVKEIDYDENVISRLVIVDQNGSVRFTLGQAPKTEKTDDMYKKLLALKLDEESMNKWLAYYKVDFAQELSDDQIEFILDRFAKQLGKGDK
jgi:hypothetical protein